MVDENFVQQLLNRQCPQWADLPLKAFASDGTDNRIFRLGDDKVVRMPCTVKVADGLVKEFSWLPKFAPQLPLKISLPLVLGLPADGYAWHWSIYQWIDGQSANLYPDMDLQQAAMSLAAFIKDLQAMDSAVGPVTGEHNSFRGVHLITRDTVVAEAIKSLHGVIDTNLATLYWQQSLQAPTFSGVGTWLHGDLHPGNLLIKNSYLIGVIDWGLMGVGDPACDLMVGWTFLDAPSRKLFRQMLLVDDQVWVRGRGWALYFGLVALAYYLRRNSGLAKIARRTIEQVLQGD